MEKPESPHYESPWHPQSAEDLNAAIEVIGSDGAYMGVVGSPKSAKGAMMRGAYGDGPEVYEPPPENMTAYVSPQQQPMSQLPPPVAPAVHEAPPPAPSTRTSKSHYTLSGGTQNQGNVLGDRSCVRQSKLYRQYESGNSMKAIFGHDHLAWKTDEKEGAYAGQSLYDHAQDGFIKNMASSPQDGLAGVPSRAHDGRAGIRPGSARYAAQKDTQPW